MSDIFMHLKKKKIIINKFRVDSSFYNWQKLSSCIDMFIYYNNYYYNHYFNYNYYDYDDDDYYLNYYYY